jgi:hypothetical protein
MKRAHTRPHAGRLRLCEFVVGGVHIWIFSANGQEAKILMDLFSRQSVYDMPEAKDDESESPVRELGAEAPVVVGASSFSPRVEAWPRARGASAICGRLARRHIP